MHELAVAGDRDHSARHALGGDLAREEIVHPRQADLREAGLVGLGFRQRPGSGRVDGDGRKEGRAGDKRFHERLPADRSRAIIRIVIVCPPAPCLTRKREFCQ